MGIFGRLDEFFLKYEYKMAEEWGLGWANTFRLEDAFIAIGWFFLGMTVASVLWATLAVKAQQYVRKYAHLLKAQEALMDKDFSALRIVDNCGKQTVILKGNTILEVLDAVLSYFILFFYPKRYMVFKSRRRAKVVMYTLLVLISLIALLGLFLTFHVTVEYTGYPVRG